MMLRCWIPNRDNWRLTSMFRFILLFLVVVGYAEAQTGSRTQINQQSPLPLVVSTWSINGYQYAPKKAWDTLVGMPLLGTESRQNWRRLYALVAGLEECEHRQCDGTVGYGGSPDERGETTLDALLMDGPAHRTGAVAALRRVKQAAKAAWAVMNYTKHSLLVGEKATAFAISMGLEESSLSTNASMEMHRNWLANNCQPNYRQNVAPDPTTSCGPYKPLPSINTRQTELVGGSGAPISTILVEIPSAKPNEGLLHHDTLGMIVIDELGDISAGTSSNGANNKIPGRVGDSPIPGAGAYVDNDVGAAVATGNGDVMMRFSPSFFAVELMGNGASPTDAAKESIRRISRYYPNFFGALVVANKNGEHYAACSGMPSGHFDYSLVNHATGGEVKTQRVYCLKESSNDNSIAA